MTEEMKRGYGYAVKTEFMCMRKWVLANTYKKEIVNMPYIKNIEHEKVVNLAGEVEYMPGQVVSKTLAQNEAVSVTLFAFEKGEEIGTHDSKGDAMVTVLDGTGEFTVGGVKHVCKAGEALVMPATIPHAVYALERFKMLLTVVFPLDK